MTVNTFSKLSVGGVGVILPIPDQGYSSQIERYQAVGVSASGGVYVYDKGALQYMADITWTMTDANLNALRTFLTNTAEWCTNELTYQDHYGNTYTGRLAEPRMTPTKTAGGRWQVALRFYLDGELA